MALWVQPKLADWVSYVIGISLTSSVILAFTVLENFGLSLGGRIPVLFLALVGAAYLGGLRAAGSGCVLMIIYCAFYLSAPDALFTYSDYDLQRLVGVILCAPLVALIVGSLRHRIDALIETGEPGREEA